MAYFWLSTTTVNDILHTMKTPHSMDRFSFNVSAQDLAPHQLSHLLKTSDSCEPYKCMGSKWPVLAEKFGSTNLFLSFGNNNYPTPSVSTNGEKLLLEYQGDFKLLTEHPKDVAVLWGNLTFSATLLPIVTAEGPVIHVKGKVQGGNETCLNVEVKGTQIGRDERENFEILRRGEDVITEILIVDVAW